MLATPPEPRATTAAVLVTHNRPELLREALAALKLQTCPLDRLVVVDNASGPETRAILAGTEGIEVVRSETNRGGAGGFALGMEHAMAKGVDWMWLMDDDAIAEPAAFENLRVRLPNLPDKPGAVCSCVMEFGAIATIHRRSFNPLIGYERALSSAKYLESAVKIDTASFVGFLVSAPAVLAAGLPNAAFFLSYDDTEYSLRLGKHGFGVWLVPSSVIVHKRTRKSRLRATPFGAKHYFNVRNRIVVKGAYSRFGRLGAALGAAFGLAMWICSPGRFRSGAWQVLAGAVQDGYAARLGPFPERLGGVAEP